MIILRKIGNAYIDGTQKTSLSSIGLLTEAGYSLLQEDSNHLLLNGCE